MITLFAAWSLSSDQFSVICFYYNEIWAIIPNMCFDFVTRVGGFAMCFYLSVSLRAKIYFELKRIVRS